MRPRRSGWVLDRRVTRPPNVAGKANAGSAPVIDEEWQTAAGFSAPACTAHSRVNEKGLHHCKPSICRSRRNFRKRSHRGLAGFSTHHIHRWKRPHRLLLRRLRPTLLGSAIASRAVAARRDKADQWGRWSTVCSSATSRRCAVSSFRSSRDRGIGDMLAATDPGISGRYQHRRAEGKPGICPTRLG